MILGEVEETITTVEIDDETYEEIIKVGSSAGRSTACVVWDCRSLSELWRSCLSRYVYDPAVLMRRRTKGSSRTCLCGAMA